MHTLGHLFDHEMEIAHDWWDAHKQVCEWASGKKYAGAIGGVSLWEICNTSIGQLISLRCTCGASKLVNGLKGT